MADVQKAVVVDTEGATAVIRLNRPDVMNAMNVDMAEGLLEAVSRIAAMGEIRAVLVRGEGRSFCAGGDVAGFVRNQGRITDHIDELVGPLHKAISALVELPVPSVAMLHGAVAGAGFGLAMACDFAVAAHNSKFTLAYSRLGASPDSASSWMLPRLVGFRKAMEIALLSDLFDAEEALRLGLVNKVVPADRIESEVQSLLARLAQGPTRAYGRIKTLMRASGSASLDAQLAAEFDAFQASARTNDFAEGVKAFVDKRNPQFGGG
jgi:2-(1,2-epoxy-1,2-dihydrophenyl)acetyl-CoA isomerase